MTEIRNERDPKRRFDLLVRLLRPNAQPGNASDIKSIHEMFVTRFCSTRGEQFIRVKELLEKVAANA